MNLRSGSRLGPYEIVSPIGAGGTGELYKAKDTRLGRDVAIEILPAESAQETKLKTRFEREAKTISALNHPHIGTLHDVGSDNGFDYLVLEYCEGPTLAPAAAEPGTRRCSGRPWMAILLAGVIASAALNVFLLRRSPAKVVQQSAVSIIVEQPPVILTDGVLPLAISPDGRAILYVAGHPRRLYLRSLAAEGAKAFPGTDSAEYPFFSPDGSSIGFVHEGQLKQMPAAGGVPRTICCDGPPPAGTAPRDRFRMPAWGKDGKIYFRRDAGLYAVSADGGPAVPLTRPGSNERHSHPSLLPGGRKLLFDISSSPGGDINDRTFALLDLDTGKTSRIFRGGSQPRYSSTGHLLYARSGSANLRTATIFSVQFDASSGRVTGKPMPRVTDVQAFPVNGTGYWEAAANGTIVYVPHDPANSERELVWLDRLGVPTPATGRLEHFADVALSPDGMRVAFDDLSSIWVGDLSRNIWNRVAEGGQYNRSPVWSPDGRQIAFESARDGHHGLYVIPANGSKPAKLLTSSASSQSVSSWSPDGKTIAYARQATSPGETFDLWSVDPTTGKAKALVVASRPQHEPVFSPDGRWIAFVTPRLGEYDIHVQSFPGLGPRHTLVVGTACEPGVACIEKPVWSPDGRELFFKSGKKLMTVELQTTSGRITAGTPRVLFEAELDSFDVSADGKLFLASRLKRHARWDRLNLVSGWWAGDLDAVNPADSF